MYDLKTYDIYGYCCGITQAIDMLQRRIGTHRLLKRPDIRPPDIKCTVRQLSYCPENRILTYKDTDHLSEYFADFRIMP